MFFPIFFLESIYQYFEFLIFSISIKFIIYILSITTLKDKIFEAFLNYSQILYSFIILYIFSSSLNIDGSINETILIGDVFDYYNESLSFSKMKNLSNLELVLLTNSNYFLYQYILSLLFTVFETKYLIGLLFSVLIGLINMVILSKIAILITNNRKILYYTLFFFLISPHLLASSTTLLKDNLIVLSFFILILSILSIIKNNNYVFFNYCLLIFSIFFCFLLRIPFVYLYVLIVLFFLIYFKKLNFKIILISSFLILLFFYSEIVIYSSTMNQGNIFELFSEQQNRLGEDKNKLYGSGITSFLVSDYSELPTYLKILNIPRVIIVQYLTPINIFNFNHITPWSYIDINMKIIWLIFLGPLFLFTSLNSKKLNKESKILFIISLLGYIFIAYVQTGIVPRYALCFMALSLFPMAEMFYLIKKNKIMRIKYNSFNSLYFLMTFYLVLFYLLNKI